MKTIQAFFQGLLSGGSRLVIDPHQLQQTKRRRLVIGGHRFYELTRGK
ncbi:hypothetical protein [Coraliomargarita parva]|nr:hypothetical protein [Coraliomargarita parva]